MLRELIPMAMIIVGTLLFVWGIGHCMHDCGGH